MVDDSRTRLSCRPRMRRGAPPARSGRDPLAELARLIGQRTTRSVTIRQNARALAAQPGEPRPAGRSRAGYVPAAAMTPERARPIGGPRADSRIWRSATTIRATPISATREPTITKRPAYRDPTRRLLRPALRRFVQQDPRHGDPRYADRAWRSVAGQRYPIAGLSRSALRTAESIPTRRRCARTPLCASRRPAISHGDQPQDRRLRRRCRPLRGRAPARLTTSPITTTPPHAGMHTPMPKTTRRRAVAARS